MTPARDLSSVPSAAEAPDALVVRRLSASYGRTRVVHGVSFAARSGEVLGVTGPNGAGKTTILNSIAGLIRSDGEIFLYDARLDRSPPHDRVRRGLAIVPEGRQIIGSLNVQANLDVTVTARRRLRLDDEHRRRIAAVLDVFPQLRERLELPGSVLSGGEQQMLALARALMTEPKVLLLDEPSQGLAPALVEGVIEALDRLRGSMTIVLVEQNLDVLAALADRVLTLSLGRLADEPANGSNASECEEAD